MKKVIYTFLILAIFVVILVVFGDKNSKVLVGKNSDFNYVPITPNKVQDTYCKMTIRTQKHSAQVAFANHKTYFFDDVGCMVLWLHQQPKNNIPKKLWAFSEDTNRWIDATKACYKTGVHTTMHYGYGAFEKRGNECLTFDEVKQSIVEKYSKD